MSSSTHSNEACSSASSSIATTATETDVLLHRVSCVDNACSVPGCKEMAASLARVSREHHQCPGESCDILACRAGRRIFPNKTEPPGSKHTMDELWRQAILFVERRDEKRKREAESEEKKTFNSKRGRRKVEVEPKVFKEPIGGVSKGRVEKK